MSGSDSLPKYNRRVGIGYFAGDLRDRVFSSQVKAAEFFSVNPSTIHRYETGALRPPIGYMASLVMLLISRLENAGYAVEEYQQALMREVDTALRDSFAGWE